MAYLGTKPANAVLTSDQIADGAVGTSDLANSAVTTDKIDTAAVTDGKLSLTANSAPVKTAVNASGSAPIYACRAWVNFNGTGTVAIRASGNVSSITDNGTGDYTVNFTTAMPNADYNAVFGVRSEAATSRVVAEQHDNVTRTTTALRIYTLNGSFSPTDSPVVSVSIFR